MATNKNKVSKMIKLSDYKVNNTGNIIDINLNRNVMTENGARNIQQGLSFHDTAEGYAKILTRLLEENANRCKPPLEAVEIEQIAKSISSKSDAKSFRRSGKRRFFALICPG